MAKQSNYKHVAQRAKERLGVTLSVGDYNKLNAYIKDFYVSSRIYQQNRLTSVHRVEYLDNAIVVWNILKKKVVTVFSKNQDYIRGQFTGEGFPPPGAKKF